MCIFTKTAHPEVCHIIPFAINAKQANITIFQQLHSSSAGLLGKETAMHLNALVTGAPGSSDKSWNMLCLHPLLHSFWGKCLFAIKCLGIIPSDDKNSIVQLQFHWMPRNIQRHNDLIQPPCKDAVQELMEGLNTRQDTIPGFSVFKNDSARELETGETFDILLEKEDAEKMKIVLDVQWAVIRLSALSGAAGDWDLEENPDEEGATGDAAAAERVENWIESLPPSTPH